MNGLRKMNIICHGSRMDGSIRYGACSMLGLDIAGVHLVGYERLSLTHWKKCTPAVVRCDVAELSIYML